MGFVLQFPQQCIQSVTPSSSFIQHSARQFRVRQKFLTCCRCHRRAAHVVWRRRTRISRRLRDDALPLAYHAQPDAAKQKGRSRLGRGSARGAGGAMDTGHGRIGASKSYMYPSIVTYVDGGLPGAAILYLRWATAAAYTADSTSKLIYSLLVGILATPNALVDPFIRVLRYLLMDPLSLINEFRVINLLYR